MTDQLLCSPAGTPGLECTPPRVHFPVPQNIPQNSSLRMSRLEAYNFPLAQYRDFNTNRHVIPYEFQTESPIRRNPSNRPQVI